MVGWTNRLFWVLLAKALTEWCSTFVLVSIDFFAVPTLTGRILFVHHRYERRAA